MIDVNELATIAVDGHDLPKTRREDSSSNSVQRSQPMDAYTTNSSLVSLLRGCVSLVDRSVVRPEDSGLLQIEGIRAVVRSAAVNDAEC